MKLITRCKQIHYRWPLLLVLLLVVVPIPAFATLGGETISGFIYGFFITIGGIVTWLGGLVLDFAVDELVIGMGDYLNSNVGVVVNSLWTIVRDVFNIAFIFALIYLGLKTIVKTDDSSTRRQLGMLIIAALLINFSLLATKVIVDFSNIAAQQIYRQITVTDIKGGETVFDFNNLQDPGKDGAFAYGMPKRTSISGAFMQNIRLTSYANDGVLQQLKKNDGWIKWRFIMFGFVMMLFMILTGIVFFMGGIILISRFVALIIFMIFSPLMLAGLIYPGMKKFMDMWWEKFLGHAFVAPAFIFMLYLSLRILQSLQPAGGSLAGAFSTNENDFSEGFLVLGNFILMAGFMYGSVVVAQKMGAAGAGGSLKLLNNVGNTIRGAAQGFAYRNTAGYGLSKIVQGLDRLEESMTNSERSDSSRSWLNRNLRKVGRGAARTALTDEAIRRSVEAGANYGAGGRGRAKFEADEKARAKRAATNIDATELKDVMTRFRANPNDVDTAIELEAKLAKAGKSELEAIANSRGGMDLLTTVSGSFDKKLFDGLMESDELDTGQKGALAASRKVSIRNAITRAGGDDFQKGLAGASAAQIDSLDFKDFVESDDIIYTQDKQVDKLDGLWGTEKMRLFKEKRKQKIEAAASTPAGMQALLKSRKGEKEIAKLPDKVFTDHLTNFISAVTSGATGVPQLSGGMLEQIAKESGLTGTQKKGLGAAVSTLYATGPGMPDDIQGFFSSPIGAPFRP